MTFAQTVSGSCMFCDGYSGPCEHEGIERPCRTMYCYDAPAQAIRLQAQYENETDKVVRSMLEELLVENDRLLEEGDPNRNPVLCDKCFEEYTEYWDDAFNSYYSGIL